MRGGSAAAERSMKAEGHITGEVLKEAIEVLDEGFALYDAEDRLVAFNSRLCEIYDQTPDEYPIGIAWSELMRRNVAAGRYIEAAGREEAFIAEREARRREMTGSYEIRLTNGRWLRATDRRTRDGGMVSIRTEITEQKEAARHQEETARETEERLREIVAANPVPMTITRVRDGLVVYANQRAADMVMMPLDRVLGASSIDFFADPSDRETVLHLLRTQGKVELMEVRFKRGDGTTFPLALICRPITYAGEPATVTGFHDLSDWKRMETALHQSEKMAALGSLLAGVAHELNNPLTVVVTQSVLMEETAADARAASRAEKIRLAAERCSRIVRTFLALARQRQSTPSMVRINEVVTAAADLLAYQLRTTDVRLTLELDEGLPAFWADADQLSQVVTNLIVNAAQACAEREQPRLLKVATAVDASTGRVRLCVIDNGPGVAPEIRSRIFEPFFTTKGADMGTGIGLSMCQNIVAAHGGVIAVEETPGGGATFTVDLPLRMAEAVAPAEDTRSLRRAPARILVVDDEPEISESLAELLGSEGHTVDTAENGAVALRRLAAQPYDAVISDLRMPILDGPGLYRAIEQRHPELAPRTGFVTGDSLSPDIRKFLSGTDVACIEKPFARDDVRRLVARLLPQPAG